MKLEHRFPKEWRLQKAEQRGFEGGGWLAERGQSRKRRGTQGQSWPEMLALGRAQKRQGSTTEGEARDGSYAGERPENAPKMSGPKGLSKTQQVLSDFLHKNFFAWQENSKSEIAKETAR